MASKFRKKPIVIEAMKWTGENRSALKEFCPEIALGPEYNSVVIHTLEGVLAASIGDWIIKGVAGEFHPCKPDIFDATYEHVEHSN